MTHIVKRKGHKEEYDERKLYASVYSACFIAHMQKPYAEECAQKVSSKITKWIKGRSGVNSGEIFKKTGDELEKLSRDAALMYRTHRDIS